MDAVYQGAQGFQGYCYNCNAWGHPASRCPQPPVKGWNKGGPMQSVNQQGGPIQSVTQQTGVTLDNTGQGGQSEAAQPTVWIWGGAEGANPGPATRPLKELFEEAGWTVASSKKTTEPPNMSRVFELLELDKTVSYINDRNQPPPNCQPGYEWQALSVTVDSGACDHVVPPGEIDTSEVRTTEAVKSGVHYTTASGPKIPNLGKKSSRVY
jgi:hypothetical protein